MSVKNKTISLAVNEKRIQKFGQDNIATIKNDIQLFDDDDFIIQDYFEMLFFNMSIPQLLEKARLYNVETVKNIEKSINYYNDLKVQWQENEEQFHKDNRLTYDMSAKLRKLIHLMMDRPDLINKSLLYRLPPILMLKTTTANDIKPFIQLEITKTDININFLLVASFCVEKMKTVKGEVKEFKAWNLCPNVQEILKEALTDLMQLSKKKRIYFRITQPTIRNAVKITLTTPSNTAMGIVHFTKVTLLKKSQKGSPELETRKRRKAPLNQESKRRLEQLNALTDFNDSQQQQQQYQRQRIFADEPSDSDDDDIDDDDEYLGIQIVGYLLFGSE